MAKNRGKDFEKIIRDAISKCDDVWCERLHDGMSGYVVVSRNPSDFIVYKQPYMYYVECKSIHGASIPIANLVQLDLIAERCKISGVKGKFIIWFIEHQKTFWVDYSLIQGFIKLGYKSINYQKLIDCEGATEIPATYKRVYGNYDFSSILR